VPVIRPGAAPTRTKVLDHLGIEDEDPVIGAHFGDVFFPKILTLPKPDRVAEGGRLVAGGKAGRGARTNVEIKERRRTMRITAISASDARHRPKSWKMLGGIKFQTMDQSAITAERKAESVVGHFARPLFTLASTTKTESVAKTAT
jgi:hypothetical protein